jgi:ATP-binding cassette, subfamily C (CFTR/MRP), member 1
MVNLMQVNTQSFVDLTIYLNMLWSGPLQIGICLYMLWTHLGVASLAGLVVMIILIPINIFVSNKAKLLQAEKFKVQDKRIKQTNEILNGIKVLDRP